MQIVTDGKAALEKAVLALGMFDGVHIGHRVLLQRAKVLARRSHVPLVACTFTTHPLALIAPDKCPPVLTTFAERAALLEAAGVDLLFAQPFTEEMRQMAPEVYVGELVRRFHPVDVVCGFNHTFGKGGSGTSAFLSALGGGLGFRTQVVPQVTLDGEEVSSSVIRQALAQGNAAQAARLLQRPYQLGGTVTPEKVNHYRFTIAEPRKQQLPQGRYRCLLCCQDAGKTLPCVARIDQDGAILIALQQEILSQTADLLFVDRLLAR